jgi:hypothetical protein
MATAQVKHHDYHLVDPSPWPIVGSISVFIMAVGAISWMHHLYAAAWMVFGLGTVGVLYTMASWWGDVIREAQYQGYHTRVVQLSHRYGMILFIASEVMFFVAWFWELVPAIETHEAKFGRTPRVVAADAGFYSAKNEAAAKAKGVKRISVPNRSTKSPERKRLQKKRWFRNGQKWRTGCEGRISVIKRRHGLNRCRYKGDAGMKRWVGLGVIADNLINIGNAMAKQSGS